MNGSVASNIVPISAAETQYKDGLRRGFIDLRNSCREKKSRQTPYSRTMVHTEGDRSMLGYGHDNHPPGVEDNFPFSIGSYESPSSISRADRRPLLRSNSSLDLDHADEEMRPPLRKDYGSVDSLDVINNDNEFFDMLQDFQSSDPDQRAPAPPHIRDVLRGNQEVSVMINNSNKQGRNNSTKHSSSHGNIHEHLASVDLDGDEALVSPRLKQKTQKNSRKDKSKRGISSMDTNSGGSGGGILRRIRGKPESSEVSVNMDCQDGCLSVEEKWRRKAIVHYDCQSIGATLIKNRFDDTTQIGNISTGASAASVKRRTSLGVFPITENMVVQQEDQGDRKSNMLLRSCPYFRNELGGEEERIICLNRANGKKAYHQVKRK